MTQWTVDDDPLRYQGLPRAGGTSAWVGTSLTVYKTAICFAVVGWLGWLAGLLIG